MGCYDPPHANLPGHSANAQHGGTFWPLFSRVRYLAREAGARRFTYVYEATTAAPGSVESENWITWKTSPQEDRRFNAVDFRNELEFGVTEHFQIGLYLADWGYREDPGANEHGFQLSIFST